MNLQDFGFGDSQIVQWAEVLRCFHQEVRPGGPWSLVVGDVIQGLPERERSDAYFLLCAVIAAAEWRGHQRRHFHLSLAQFSARNKYGAARYEAVQTRNSLNKDHISNFQTLMYAGYAHCQGDVTICKARWEPFAEAITKLPDYRGDDITDSPQHRAYKALQRRFHGLRKANKLDNAGLLQLGGELFINLRNLARLQPPGIRRRVTKA